MAAQDERRRAPRRRTRLTVAVAWAEPPEVVRGTFKDLSDVGGRILLDEDVAVPDSFDAIQLTAGILHECRVVWRAETLVGVAFNRSTPLKGAQEPRLMKRAQLWIRLLNR
jgi:PilZ domain